MSESRSAQRRRVLKGGSIDFNGGSIACIVRNLSSIGAALDVASPVGIPDRFVFVLGVDHLRRPCHVVWRSDKRIGIAFD